MSSNEDPLKAFLESTGWSCEDLLKKLQQYSREKETSKNVNSGVSNPSTSKDNNIENNEICKDFSDDNVDIPKFPDGKRSENIEENKIKTVDNVLDDEKPANKFSTSDDCDSIRNKKRETEINDKKNEFENITNSINDLEKGSTVDIKNKPENYQTSSVQIAPKSIKIVEDKTLSLNLSDYKESDSNNYITTLNDKSSSELSLISTESLLDSTKSEIIEISSLDNSLEIIENSDGSLTRSNSTGIEVSEFDNDIECISDHFDEESVNLESKSDKEETQQKIIGDESSAKQLNTIPSYSSTQLEKTAKSDNKKTSENTSSLISGDFELKNLEDNNVKMCETSLDNNQFSSNSSVPICTNKNINQTRFLECEEVNSTKNMEYASNDLLNSILSNKNYEKSDLSPSYSPILDMSFSPVSINEEIPATSQKNNDDSETTEIAISPDILGDENINSSSKKAPVVKTSENSPYSPNDKTISLTLSSIQSCNDVESASECSNNKLSESSPYTPKSNMENQSFISVSVNDSSSNYISVGSLSSSCLTFTPKSPSCSPESIPSDISKKSEKDLTSNENEIIRKSFQNETISLSDETKTFLLLTPEKHQNFDLKSFKMQCDKIKISEKKSNEKQCKHLLKIDDNKKEKTGDSTLNDHKESNTTDKISCIEKEIRSSTPLSQNFDVLYFDQTEDLKSNDDEKDLDTRESSKYATEEESKSSNQLNIAQESDSLATSQNHENVDFKTIEFTEKMLIENPEIKETEIDTLENLIKIEEGVLDIDNKVLKDQKTENLENSPIFSEINEPQNEVSNLEKEHKNETKNFLLSISKKHEHANLKTFESQYKQMNESDNQTLKKNHQKGPDDKILIEKEEEKTELKVRKDLWIHGCSVTENLPSSNSNVKAESFYDKVLNQSRRDGFELVESESKNSNSNSGINNLEWDTFNSETVLCKKTAITNETQTSLNSTSHEHEKQYHKPIAFQNDNTTKSVQETGKSSNKTTLISKLNENSIIISTKNNLEIQQDTSLMSRIQEKELNAFEEKKSNSSQILNQIGNCNLENRSSDQNIDGQALDPQLKETQEKAEKTMSENDQIYPVGSLTNEPVGYVDLTPKENELNKLIDTLETKSEESNCVIIRDDKNASKFVLESNDQIEKTIEDASLEKDVISAKSLNEIGTHSNDENQKIYQDSFINAETKSNQANESLTSLKSKLYSIKNNHEKEDFNKYPENRLELKGATTNSENINHFAIFNNNKRNKDNLKENSDLEEKLDVQKDNSNIELILYKQKDDTKEVECEKTNETLNHQTNYELKEFNETFSLSKPTINFKNRVVDMKRIYAKLLSLSKESEEETKNKEKLMDKSDNKVELKQKVMEKTNTNILTKEENNSKIDIKNQKKSEEKNDPGIMSKNLIGKEIIVKKLKTGGLIKKKLNFVFNNTKESGDSNIFRKPLPVDTPKPNLDIEELRKSLRMQITTLRNRKKPADIFKGQCNNLATLNDLKLNYKKKYEYKSEDLTKFGNKIDAEIEGKQESKLFDDNKKSSVKVAELKNLPVEKDENGDNECIKLTKTDDITKIKGWQNKKFEEKANKCEKTSMSPLIKSTVGKDDISPFISDSLDEFLTDENSKLKISYKIPKLFAEEAVNNEKYETLMANSRKKNKIDNTDSNSQESKTQENVKTFKPKTLAEKRRMLEQEQKKLEMDNSDSSSQEAKTADNVKIFKPKTLAEKRRMMEKENKKLETSESKSLEVKVYKPKTLAEKRRMMEKEHKNVEKNKKCEEKEVELVIVENQEHDLNKTCFIKYNEMNLYVASKIQNQCLGSLKRKRSPSLAIQNISNSKKKSLLSDLKTEHKKFNYKPGPLSQKFRLFKDSKDWISCVKKLPQVYLEIEPKCGKPINPEIRKFLPTFNFEIDDFRINFALSALKIGRDSKKSYLRFPLKYKNDQKYISVRKRKSLDINLTTTYENPKKNCVESIIEDLLNYVETKEIGETIIKDSEPIEEEIKIDDYNTKVAEELSNLSSSKEKRKKRVDLELLRLGCKFVNVAVEDETEKKDCKKPYCKLGCVCKSLSCDAVLPTHCYNIECMFNCICPELNTNDVLNNENLLTKSTVHLIEDRAKKNLAKVEKEFTQTILQTNEKTILLPGKSKVRRVTKAPKRYSDGVTSDVTLEKSPFTRKINLPVTVSLDCIDTKCKVKLDNLQKLIPNLKYVIPFCLEHNRYECTCATSSEANTSSSEANTNLNDDKSSAARIQSVHQNISLRNKGRYYQEKLKGKALQMDHVKVDLSKFNIKENTTKEVDVENVKHSGVSQAEYLKTYLSDLAKIYMKMKKSKLGMLPNVKKIENKLEKLDQKENNDQQNDKNILGPKPVFKGELIINIPDKAKVAQQLGQKGEIKYMRMLPWLELLKNYYSGKIQIWCCRNTKNNKLILNTSLTEPPLGFEHIKNHICRGGIIEWILTRKLPNSNYKPELVHLILLPWEGHFEITGVCLKQTKDNKNGKDEDSSISEMIERSAVRLKRVQNVSLDKTVDRKKRKQSLSCSLLKSDDTVEISRDTINHSLHNQEKTDQVYQINVQNNTLQEKTDFSHKDHQNMTNHLVLLKMRIPPTHFVVCGDSDKKIDSLQVVAIAAELPQIADNLRWRMIYLDSNFTFLSFNAHKYTIKYTDLSHILEGARKSKCTVCLRSAMLSSGYKYEAYGIYAVPSHCDRLFIGPYEFDEPDGLETLRYLRKSLVTTEYFEKVQGISSNGMKPLWLKKSTIHPSKVLTIPNSPVVIINDPIVNKNKSEVNSAPKDDFAKLTLLKNKPTKVVKDVKENDEDVQNLIFKENLKIMQRYQDFICGMDLEDRPVVKFPQFLMINGRKLAKKDLNRYIVTNIPHFGYLGAVQNDKTKEIDVDWPFFNKILRFPSTNAATEFLSRRLTNLLLPVPSSFKITLLVLREIDHSTYFPVEVKTLCGTYICGEFGLKDARLLKEDQAKRLGTTKEAILLRLAKRAQFLVRCRLRTLALLLFQSGELEKDDVARVLDLGQLEINKLKELEQNYISIKKTLILKKQQNLSKYMLLLMDLPEEQRLHTYTDFQKQFNQRTTLRKNSTDQSESKKVKKDDSDLIEISDSDEEMGDKSPKAETQSKHSNWSSSSQKFVSLLNTSSLSKTTNSNLSIVKETNPSNINSNFKVLSMYNGSLILKRKSTDVPTKYSTKVLITDNKVVELHSYSPPAMKLNEETDIIEIDSDDE